MRNGIAYGKQVREGGDAKILMHPQREFLSRLASRVNICGAQKVHRARGVVEEGSYDTGHPGPWPIPLIMMATLMCYGDYWYSIQYQILIALSFLCRVCVSLIQKEYS